MTGNRAVRTRRGTLVLGASVIAMGSAGLSPALAQCSPDPAVTARTTICTGTDADGLLVDTNDSTVVVGADAVVQGADAPAITVAVPAAGNSSSVPRRAMIEVSGTVDGGAQAGIAVLSGPSNTVYDYVGTDATITVDAGATVTGGTGIAIGQSAGNSGGGVIARIDNAGTITGSDGVALASGGSMAGFQIVNRAGGTIGGVSGPVSGLDNAGTIDGGSYSAIAGGIYYSGTGSRDWTNSGTIRSDSASATVADIAPYEPFINNGTIANDGTGAAIAGTNYGLTNSDGGIITAAGGTAIEAAHSLRLVNTGRIQGDVLAGTDAGAWGSTVDSTGGVIDGNLIFGGGSEIVMARYTGSSTLYAGVSGRIDGGAGIDMVQVQIGTDTTIDTAITLFDNFERLTLELQQNATATLADGFVAPGTISLAGQGTLVNAGTFAGKGELLVAQGDGWAFDTPTIVNTGTIRSTAGDGNFAVRMFPGAGTFTNSGVIETAGAGLSVQELTNTGTITSGSTAVRTDGYGMVANSGTLRSTGGVALDLSGYAGAIMGTNTGVIDGATAGIYLSTGLINSGIITSAGTGAMLQSGGFVDNLAGGTITGGTLAIGGNLDGNRTVRNAGTITGNVDLAGEYAWSFYGDRYFAEAGGVLDGDLELGTGDTLVTELVNTGPGRFAGINGTVIATDASLRYQVRGDTSAIVEGTDLFRTVGYQLSNNAALTLTGTAQPDRTLEFAGAGSVDLAVDLATSGRAAIRTAPVLIGQNYVSDPSIIDLTSRGTIEMTRGTGNPLDYSAILLGAQDRFTNAGSVTVRGNAGDAPLLSAIRNGTVINSGTISLDHAIGIADAATLINSGSIVEVEGGTGATALSGVSRVENSGTISVSGVAVRNYGYYPSLSLDNAAGATIASSSGAAVRAYGGQVTNAGTITGTVDLGYTQSFDGTPDRAYATGRYTAAGGTVSGDVLFGRSDDAFVQTGEATGVAGLIDGGDGNDVYLHQVATSRTVALGDDRVTGFEHLVVNVADAEAVATLAADDGFTGTLTVQGAGTVVNSAMIDGLISTYAYYPVYNVLNGPGTMARLDNRGTITGHVQGQFGTVVNSGTIDGSLTLETPGTVVENLGVIAGAARLSYGDDTFVQYGSGTLDATLDGWAGADLFVMAADADGSISADRINGFERAMQTGTETIAWSGDFHLSTIELEGGTLAVAAGQTLSTGGLVTVSGGDGGVAVRNEGAIAGAVLLGSGDDRYTEGAGATAASIDGGAGADTFGALLAGDRTGISARSGFERLVVEGTGTLTLALDQDFTTVDLAGTGLVAALNGHAIGRIDGGGGAEQVVVDGDTAAVALGAGDDLLSLGAATLAGDYAGGPGVDTLRLAAAQPVTLAGRAGGFDTLMLDSGALTVTGTLGAAGELLTFGGNAQVLTLVGGGSLAGTIDLGDGDDRFRIDRGGILAGAVSGGGGSNVAELAIADGLTLTGSLRDFTQVIATGAGTLTIANGAALATGQLLLGPDSSRVVIDGIFAGAIAGHGGDSVAVTGGSADRPVAFTDLAGIAELQIAGGWSTLAGQAMLDRLAMSGGRFVGLPGSTLSAAQIAVGTSATFGSAGTVNGDLTIAGTLSPGASPGTMLVNGNVALAAGSTAMFEIDPAAADLLTINGALTIAEGATLQLIAEQRVSPGQSLDLITATGGINGSFTNVVQPASLFGFVVQDDTRIALVGAFRNDAAFTPPVQGAVEYVNDPLTAGLGSPALLAAVPLLLDGAGGTDAAGFAQLTPQPYAAATQLVVEQGLELARTARGDAFAAPGDMPRPFAFAAALGRTGELAGGPGVARARSDSYGVIGGLGWGSQAFSVGAFIGTLDQQQNLRSLGARTDADGLVAGLHARWSGVALGAKATITYADGDATTTRNVPGGGATGGYGLTGWTADLALDYAVPLGTGWILRPGIGATAIRATRRQVTESGDTPFLLDIARNRYEAVFVDSSVTVMRVRTATIRPHLTAGLRYRVDGDRPEAFAALSGGPLTLSATGAARAALTAQGTLGAEASVSRALTLFGSAAGEAGKNTSQGSAQLGMRVAF